MHVLESKDVGSLSKFVGIHFLQCDDGSINIDQEQTIVERLDTVFRIFSRIRVPFGINDPSKPYDQILLPIKCTALSKKATIIEFQSLTDSLLQLTRCTGPDIEFEVHNFTRSCHAPAFGDWKLAKRFAQYVSGARTTFQHMKLDDKPTFPLQLVSCADADFAGDVDNRKLISASIQFVNGLIAGSYC